MPESAALGCERMGQANEYANKEDLGRFAITPFAGVNNLFDREYNGNVRINAARDRYFEPAPDRNVYGGLSFRYDFGG